PPAPTPFPYTTLFRSQSRARKLHARRARSRASRGLTIARSVSRVARADQLAEACMRQNLRRDVSSALVLLYIDRLWRRPPVSRPDRKSTRLNSSHEWI